MLVHATGNPTSEANGDIEHDYKASELSVIAFALFFLAGGITSLNDIIIPKLRELFTLTYGEALLVQTAFFAAYAIISVPASSLVRRVGYLRSAVAAMAAVTAGCLLFVPSAALASFPFFLVALFVLASGITTLLVVLAPLTMILGPPATAHSRLSFAQGFNSLGTTIFPYVGSALILGGLASPSSGRSLTSGIAMSGATEARTIVTTYVGLAAICALVGAVVWLYRNRLHEEQDEVGGILHAFDLLRQPRFAFGALCIFLYVGAEVTIGSLVVNYLETSTVLGLTPVQAGQHVAYYWGGALVGRFIGAFVLRALPPAKVLMAVAAGALVLLAASASSTGFTAAWAFLAIGLMNSVMFPTIFVLASQGLGRRTAQGSGLMSMAVVGGAMVPPLTGVLADAAGSLRVAFIIPAVCYAAIGLFGRYCLRRA